MTAPADGLAIDVRLILRRAEVAVLARLDAGYGFSDTAVASERYLDDAEVRARLGASALRPTGTRHDQLAAARAAAADSEAALARDPATSAAAVAATRLGLSAAETAILRCALAYATSHDVRRLCHLLAEDRGPALYADACAALCPSVASPTALLAALSPAGPLCATGLLIIEGDAARGDTLTRRLSPARFILDWAAADPRLADPVATAIIHERTPGVWMAPELVAALDEAAGAPLLVICGPRGAGKAAAAARLAATAGTTTARIALAKIDPTRDPTAAARALAICRLAGALPYIDTGPAADSAAPAVTAMAAALARDPRPVVIGVVPRKPHLVRALCGARPQKLITIPPATLETRRAAWSHSLSTAGVSDPAAAENLASRFVLGAGAIAIATRAAAGQPDPLAAIDRHLAETLGLDLGPLAVHIGRRATFADMVLPEDVLDTLEDMVAMVRERARILETWGFGRHLGVARGVAALFSGAPGTGKTMAASAISSALGLELYRIDLAQVVSKWVGETEKHLGRIFDEASAANAMLLFDEADSLFGKRGDVKSASDRYANLEVNYVLQRMETFDGVSVLTTNQETAIDAAFLRRLSFRVRFPEPDADERAALWTALLPREAGIDGDLDVTRLADRFEMTGGHIRNAILRAAVIAARAGRRIEPRDLRVGAHREYEEMGKVMPRGTGDW
ncbi:MAG TPA: ATP-binding protein [Kofleriaceae bacterium]|nr:ATP-binding protein [Kofleriaceae bacterium]